MKGLFFSLNFLFKRKWSFGGEGGRLKLQHTNNKPHNIYIRRWKDTLSLSHVHLPEQLFSLCTFFIIYLQFKEHFSPESSPPFQNAKQPSSGSYTLWHRETVLHVNQKTIRLPSRQPVVKGSTHISIRDHQATDVLPGINLSHEAISKTKKWPRKCMFLNMLFNFSSFATR